ncbi:molybdopterin-binding protein [Pelosinus sp. UFO1]|uniref:molybdopterin-binding protein n=1 Tax=Pelosinus sp. UFO1 TaxID=484770 RepID=UPI0004D14FD7|nr:molybdopterin-binding protein [Pelosinus sp. UFO1]AIF51103.1 molybdopterin binding domain-containing protein [Pelosinus sp. UFO1]
MKSIDVSQAIGMILGQDLTRVVPGETSGVAFKKGHIIKAEDISLMRSMGKNNVYVMEFGEDQVHENDAAEQLALLVGHKELLLSEAAEGKVGIRAQCHGLLKINTEKLFEINMLEGLSLSTLHNNSLVCVNELVAIAKIIPLVLPKKTMDQAKEICIDEELIHIIPFTAKKAGLLITGNEVYYGIIKDKFEAVIKKKFADLGSVVTETIFLPDDENLIAETIKTLAVKNDIVFVTGGMSVDPDDVTLAGVKKAGADVAVYGTPVLPGAMFMTAYLGEIPVIGIPACGMFSKVTVLDVVLPQILIGERITRQYIASLGHGGLCRRCESGCTYPHCSFAK